MFYWVSGLHPLPKCTFNVDGKDCCKLSHTPVPELCIIHQCRFLSGESRCFDSVKDEGYLFCTDHSCYIESCQSHREDKQKF